MDQLVEIIKLCSPSAIPLVVVLLGGFWIYRKTQNIEQARRVTKAERDLDSQKMHDELLRHSWELSRIKEDNSHRDQLLEDLRKQVEAVNSNLAVVATKLDHLVEAVSKSRGDTKCLS